MKKGPNSPPGLTPGSGSPGTTPSTPSKRKVIRLTEETSVPNSPSKRGIIKRLPSQPILRNNTKDGGNGTSNDNNNNNKCWLAYHHENDSHPEPQAAWISYAHEGNQYKQEVHDTNALLGDPWSVLPRSPYSTVNKSNYSTTTPATAAALPAGVPGPVSQLAAKHDGKLPLG